MRTDRVIETIREIARKTPDVEVAASRNLPAVAAWIRANWDADEIQYEYLSACRVNSFGLDDFQTEARSSRWFALREACRTTVALKPSPTLPARSPVKNVCDVLDRWAAGGLEAEERFRASLESAWLGQYVCVEGKYRQLYLGPALCEALQHELAVPETEIPSILIALTCCDGHCVGCANEAECEAIATYDPKDTRP